MNFTRRHFLKTAGVLCGAAVLPACVLELEAAEAAAVNRDELALAALVRAKKLGASFADIRINRYRHESIFTREQQVQRFRKPRPGCVAHPRIASETIPFHVTIRGGVTDGTYDQRHTYIYGARGGTGGNAGLATVRQRKASPGEQSPLPADSPIKPRPHKW